MNRVVRTTAVASGLFAGSCLFGPTHVDRAPGQDFSRVELSASPSAETNPQATTSAAIGATTFRLIFDEHKQYFNDKGASLDTEFVYLQSADEFVCGIDDIEFTVQAFKPDGALYCTNQDTLLLTEAFTQEFIMKAPEPNDTAEFVIAHELGHAVQREHGISTLADKSQAELGADCIAGTIYAEATSAEQTQKLGALTHFQNYLEGGAKTVQQRQQAFEAGMDTGLCHEYTP